MVIIEKKGFTTTFDQKWINVIHKILKINSKSTFHFNFSYIVKINENTYLYDYVNITKYALWHYAY